MKSKTFLILIIVVLVCASSFGCQPYSLELYSSVVCDVPNDGVGIKSEDNFWTGLYFSKKRMADQSCIVCGKQYSGKYQDSIIEKWDSYVTDKYEDNNNDIEFGLRSDTKQLVYINLMNKHFFETEPYREDRNISQEESVQIATEIAKSYINIEDYELLVEEQEADYQKDGKTYPFSFYFTTFARKVMNYYSSDYITIKITSKGSLASIKMGDINAFSDTTIEFSDEEVKQSIDKKAVSIYEKTEYTFIQSDINYQRIVITPAGEIGIYSALSVQLKDVSDQSMSTGVIILTVIGKAKK